MELSFRLVAALGHSDPSVSLLAEGIIALMMEVEALREAMIDEAKAKGIAPKDSLYGKEYYRTGLLTHCSAGPSDGLQKLARLFFSEKTTPNGIAMREALMLIRLGYSPEEIEQYAVEAENQAMQT